MSEPFFFPPPTAVTVAEIVALTKTVLLRSMNLTRSFDRVAALDRAGPRALTFCGGEDQTEALARTRAGACFVTTDHALDCPPDTIALIGDTPAQAFATMLAVLYPGVSKPTALFATRGISPAAFIHADARLEADVIVDPGVVIGPRAEIGAGTSVGANTVIGPGVRIGRGCAIGAQVTIAFALVGNDVVIAPGVRIGQDEPPAFGSRDHGGIGRVIIQDRVAVGANSTIDRGGLGDTILGEGSMIGGLVHITRDRTIARHAVVEAQ